MPLEDRQAVVVALSAQAALPTQRDFDENDKDTIRRGEALIAGEAGCTRCHEFKGQGTPGIAPELTGYGSRAWLVGAIADPTHPAFYGPRNDRMPSYADSLADPDKNLLPAEDVGLLADWIRADWYRRGKKERLVLEKDPPAERLIEGWIERRPEPPKPETGPYAAARTLYRQEHCALCHACTGAPGGDIAAIDASAPDLGGFASREWIAGLLDPDQVQTEKYFGSSAFRNGDMVGFVKDLLSDLDDVEKEDVRTIVIALSAEANLPAQKELDAADAERIEQGRENMGLYGCLDCHTFHGEGSASGPDLTGYGSPEWLAAIVSDPQSRRFYGRRNDGMPSYRGRPDQPQCNLFSPEQLDTIVSFLRAEPPGE
jgi:ubiquinol-cytochrome c reductase cytochrome b subunit